MSLSLSFRKPSPSKNAQKAKKKKKKDEAPESAHMEKKKRTKKIKQKKKNKIITNIIEGTKLHEKKNFNHENQRKHDNRTLNKIVTREDSTRHQKKNVTKKTSTHTKKMIKKALKVLKKQRRNFSNSHSKSSPVLNSSRDPQNENSFFRRQTFLTQILTSQQISSNYINESISLNLSNSASSRPSRQIYPLFTNLITYRLVKHQDNSYAETNSTSISFNHFPRIIAFENPLSHPTFLRWGTILVSIQSETITKTSSHDETAFDLQTKPWATLHPSEFSWDDSSKPFFWIRFTQPITFNARVSGFTTSSHQRSEVIWTDVPHQSFNFVSSRSLRRQNSFINRIDFAESFFSRYRSSNPKPTFDTTPNPLKLSTKKKTKKNIEMKKTPKKQTQKNDQNLPRNDPTILSMIPFDSNANEKRQRLQNELNAAHEELEKCKTKLTTVEKRTNIYRNVEKDLEKFWMNLTKRTINLSNRENIKKYLTKFNDIFIKFNEISQKLFEKHFQLTSKSQAQNRF